MKAAIYNPYLDTLGGGERYTMAFAKTLVKSGYSVDVQWSESSIKNKLEKRFGIDLEKVNFISNVNRGDGYDVCFWVSDGSIPLLYARKNFLHFQIPFTNVGGSLLLNKMKLFRINKVICNSLFTKRYIDKEYGVDSVVVYPPVDTEKIKSKRKENLIIAIGRFSQLKQAKRQDVLIETFKKLKTDWKLVLAGGSEVGSKDYVENLRKLSEGYNIEIIESASFNLIRNLYGKAKIFWSASGYGVNAQENPEKVEHFGISVVEAMSAGAVPIVFSGGGHKEIISNGESGYLWQKNTQLIKKTEKLINDRKLLKSLARKAVGNAKSYGYEKFEAEVKSLFN